jgi:hypothetical protein
VDWDVFGKISVGFYFRKIKFLSKFCFFASLDQLLEHGGLDFDRIFFEIFDLVEATFEKPSYK